MVCNTMQYYAIHIHYYANYGINDIIIIFFKILNQIPGHLEKSIRKVEITSYHHSKSLYAYSCMHLMLKVYYYFYYETI